MIVDDLPDVCEQLTTAIKLSAKFESIALEMVPSAGNGHEAIELVDRYKPDVILMDLEMPKLGGLSAATRIKAFHPDICIIALTIHDSPATRLATLQAGMDGLISKGASISQIVKEVHARSIKNDLS